MTVIGNESVRAAEAMRLQSLRVVGVPPLHLRLTEHFWCIEGEGLGTGQPTYLVRFSGCNLRCRQCDTKFSSWYDLDYTHVPIDELYETIRTQPGRPVISYTGGEPLFRSAHEVAALAHLIMRLNMYGYRQKIETSGTVVPPPRFPSHALFWSIAPKVGSGMGTTGTYCDTARLEGILREDAHPTRAHVKFVIGDDMAGDCTAIRALVESVPLLDQYPIVFTPEGLTDSTIEYVRRYTTLVEHVQMREHWALALRDFRILPQLHQVMWRNERGR